MCKLNALLLACISSVCALTVQAQNISVSIAPTRASLLVTGPQEFTATVTNDVTNRGVTWTVAPAGGTLCTGVACGTVSATSTASGAPTTYEAPPTAPTGGTVMVTATSVTDPTKSASATVTITSGVNNPRLNGDYAFTFDGMSAGGSFVFAGVGRFTTDGAGNVTNGELDINASQYPGPVVPQEPFTGTYAIGADNRGVMTWDIPSGGAAGGTQRFAKFAFALMANGSAMFSVFDPVGGRTELGSGTMEKVDTAAYNTARITGDYAFGVVGVDHSNNRAAFAGRLTADGAGNFTNVDAVLNASGTANSATFTSSTYAVSDTSSGRGTIHLTALVGGVLRSFNFVFYIVNAGKLLAMETDQYAISAPLLNGVLLHQQAPAGGFSNASLNGGMVIYLTGRSVCGSGTGPAPNVLAGLLTADSNGALTLTYDQNCGGTPNFSSNQFGTYGVAGNGRSSITVGTAAWVAYLVSSNQAFVLGTDSSALFGFGEPQAAGALANNAVMGTYAGFTTTIATFGAGTLSGEFTADGASPNGNITGVEDISDSSGPNSGVAFNATYSVSASPTNGRGTMSVTSGSGGSAIMYVVSTSKFVAVSSSDPNPAVLSFEQSSPPPSLSLSSLTLNPTSVIGGAQSSTGTVTLSGLAPAGGAQVLLASSNGAASVPPSVTVPAGANSATFPVSTSAVAASTPVTISASYGGVTQTASLTVTAAAGPNYTLSASPTSLSIAQGTSGRSTVTVTPQNGFGGSVSLFASGLPSGVTATFSPNPATTTSTLTLAASSAATSGTVTVTIRGTSGTLTNMTTTTLTVTPPPLPTVSSLTLNPTSVIGGVQSSTGTVTLSGLAPAGGAQVLLASSNGAASVPSSVTVRAGATSATFTVSTSTVLFSTSVTISASYNSTTQTASLSVLW